MTTPIELPWLNHDFEAFVSRIADLVGDETSALWLHAAEVVERLAPGISPYDRREAIFEILAPIRKVFADEFE